MNQIRSIFNSLTLRQKVSIAVAAIAVVAVLLAAARWNRERDYKPLYTGLAAEDAGAIVAKLKESGTEYRVTEGGASILVPSARADELRMTMAASGLPKSGRIGYELFDKANFGATDFAEQVNYHRAVEGELERSIMALSEVEKARVHLTFPKDSLFVEQRQQAKASVMLKLRTGAKLAPQNVSAVTHLVASAVDGLAPEAVSVIDMRGNLLNRPRTAGPADALEGSDAALEYRQRIEKDLLNKIHSTLEPVLGADKFRAGVSVECDFTSGEQSEESFDPARSVMVTSQKTEDVTSGGGSGGVPGSASNLARPPARSGSGYGTTRRTENVTYQSSRTVKRVKLPQGGIKKLSVSVLVDQTVRWDGTGAKAKRTLEPPTPEKLKVIRDLTAGVTGLTPERGDQLIVETLPFESTLSTEPPAASTPEANRQQAPAGFLLSIPGLQGNWQVAAGVGAGAVVLLVTVIGLLLRRMRRKSSTATVQQHKAVEAPDVAGVLQKQLEQRLAEQHVERELQAQEVLASLKLPPVKTKKAEVLTKELLEETKKDPQSMAQVLRTWMAER